MLRLIFVGMTCLAPFAAQAQNDHFRHNDTARHCAVNETPSNPSWMCMREMKQDYESYLKLRRTAENTTALIGALNRCEREYGVRWDSVRRCAIDQDAAMRDIQHIMETRDLPRSLITQCVMRSHEDIPRIKRCLIN